MNLINFTVWLSTGAVIGWFAGWMVIVERKRVHISLHGEDLSSEKSQA